MPTWDIALAADVKWLNEHAEQDSDQSWKCKATRVGILQRGIRYRVAGKKAREELTERNVNHFYCPACKVPLAPKVGSVISVKEIGFFCSK